MREFKRELADAILSTPDNNFNIICNGGLNQFFQIINNSLGEWNNIPLPTSAIELSEHPKFLFVLCYWLHVFSYKFSRDIKKRFRFLSMAQFSSLDGFLELDNGMNLLSLSITEEHEPRPVFAVMYWNGEQFQIYVPKKGNSFNLSTQELYNSGKDAIIKPEKDKFYGDVMKTIHPKP